MDDLFREAISRFTALAQRAEETSVAEPMAMTLATVGENGQPSARVVLLRGFNEAGFVFYTNTRSAKARQIENNTAVALCFFWDQLNEQVRIEGQAKRVPDGEADDYWKTRPRDSQIGAWASDQSEELVERADFDRRIRLFDDKFEGKDVPRPPHWSGYRVVPHRLEFWVRGAARLHERTVYQLDSSCWSKGLLYP